MGEFGRGGATLGCVFSVLCVTACYQPVDEFQTGDGAEALAAGSGAQEPLGTYDLTFVCTDNCTGTFPHTMTLEHWDAASGAFSGVGVLQNDASYTWTVSGNISPPDVNFTIIYTGSNRG